MLFRSRSSIEIQDLLGCISDIAEQENCKFILIGNESEIISQDKEIYLKIKEKVIGHTYSFVQNVQDVLDNELKDIDLGKYKQQFISELINRECINFRVLLQSLDIYYKLKKIINNFQFSYFNDENTWSAFLYQLLKACYYTKDKYSKPELITENEEEKSYLNMLKIIENEHMKFEFVKIMCEKGICKRKVIRDEMIIYIKNEKANKKEKEIHYLRNNFYLLEDKEVLKKFDVIKNDLESNKIDYLLYPQIISLYYRLISIGLVVSYNSLDEIIDKMEINIKENKREFNKLAMPYFFEDIPKEFVDEYKKRIQYLINIQESSLLEDRINLTDINEWVEELRKKYKLHESVFRNQKAFIKYIDLDSILIKIIDSSNEEIDNFRGFILEISRYNSFENDMNYVENLISKIKEHIDNPATSKIKILQLKWLVDNLEKYVGIGSY